VRGPAAVAADRDDRHPLARRRILGAVDVLDGEIVDRLDDRVLQVGKAPGAGGAAAVLHESGLGGRPAFEQRPLEAADDHRPPGRRKLAVAGKGCQFGLEGIAVERVGPAVVMAKGVARIRAAKPLPVAAALASAADARPGPRAASSGGGSPHSPVFPDHPPIREKALLPRPLLGLEIDMDQPEAAGVTLEPLEIVEELQQK